MTGGNVRGDTLTTGRRSTLKDAMAKVLTLPGRGKKTLKFDDAAADDEDEDADTRLKVCNVVVQCVCRVVQLD